MSDKSPKRLRSNAGREVTVKSHRASKRRWLGSGRTRVALLAGGALLGTGGAATTAVVINDDQAATAVAVSTTRSIEADRADRADALDRADRAARPIRTPSAAPSAPATAEPTRPRTHAAKPKVVVPTWVAPMRSYMLTSCFGPRWGTEHQGIDFANDAGTPILAASAGTVIAAGDDGDGYGNKVIIQHGPGLYTLYGHGEQVLVSVGEQVRAGQRIALEGATGDVTGPHLHFEVWTAMWTRIEPAAFLRSHGVPITGC